MAFSSSAGIAVISGAASGVSRGVSQAIAGGSMASGGAAARVSVATVSGAAVSGPAVVTVWAQWCGPCREELPWFQRLHERAGDRLTVLGVNWQDLQPRGALEFAAVAGVTFPSAADPDATLPSVRGLPVLYLVDEEGDVTVRRGQVADYAELAALVDEHTGVSVDAG